MTHQEIKTICDKNRLISPIMSFCEKDNAIKFALDSQITEGELLKIMMPKIRELVDNVAYQLSKKVSENPGSLIWTTKTWYLPIFNKF